MTSDVRRIDRALLDRVSAEAPRNPRLRMHHNFHRHEEPVQRFLNAVEPGSYVRPHRHVDPPKWELFVCLRGRGASITFDNAGRIAAIHRLDPDRGDYGIEMSAGARAWVRTWFDRLSARVLQSLPAVWVIVGD